MARLYVFVEGQSEQTFADSVMQPHLAMHGVYMQRAILIARARKKQRTHRGGGRNYIAMKNDILRLLSQEKAADVFFTTMIDLYAIPPAFPGFVEGEKLRHLPGKRVESLERAFEEDIGEFQRFIGHRQLHEFETYLFCDVTRFAFFFKRQAKGIEGLQAIADAHATPELIDDGEQSAPSKRIIANLPDYKRNKATVGPKVAELIGLGTIRSKCPHFNGWLTRLENLGR